MMLSVVIPSRNEQFLARTIEDLLEHSSADTEVIAVLDGQWASPPIAQHERVVVAYVPESIGQRDGTDLAAKLARGKYIMKVDAHCSFEQGFDTKMVDFFKKHGDNITAVPIMKNLHAFNWKCRRCKWTKYQGPTPLRCGNCNDSRYIVRKMVWKPRKGTHSTSYCFDKEPHFQYFSDWKDRPQYKKELEENGCTETMSLQGSCFMMTREKYWELIGGLSLGNWGNQGLEIACATWLSGGRVLVNHETWYAHMFRTQGGDFGFPYEQSGRAVQKTKDKVKELFWKKKHPSQIRPVSWLVEKFWPVNGWSQEDLERLKAEEML